MLGQLVLSSLTLGSIYALTALGFAVIYRATGLANFAQGDLMMVAAMVALVLTRDAHLPYATALAIALAVGIVTGLAVDRLAFRPLLGAPPLNQLLATVAVSQIIRSGVRAFHGHDLGSLPPLVDAAPIDIAGLRFTAMNGVVILCTMLVLAGVTLLFARTRIGWAMRAAAQNPRGAAIVGISVPGTYSAAWALTGALAAVGGLLLAPLIIVTPDMGMIANKGFVAAIIGGFSSLPGAVIGGFVLALTENLLGVFVSSSFKDVLVFGLLILVLLLRPAGLLGQVAADRS